MIITINFHVLIAFLLNREDPSIATTFDPEKDKSLYGTALGLYRQFSNADILDSDFLLNDDFKKKY